MDGHRPGALGEGRRGRTHRTAHRAGAPEIDLAFIDADKTGYADYYEELLPRLRPGGLLLVDNTLWGGAVLDEKDDSDDTVAIRALNDRIAADPRVRVVLLPIGDGLTVAQRLSA